MGCYPAGTLALAVLLRYDIPVTVAAFGDACMTKLLRLTPVLVAGSCDAFSLGKWPIPRLLGRFSFETR